MSRQKFNKALLGLTISFISVFLSSCCDDSEWSCASGQCISDEMVCDGATECQDGSDETADMCIKNICPPFAFRCAYGACVPRAAKCNGISECADNSDESKLLCNPESVSVNSICTADEFLCDGSRCLPNDAKCDGSIDCTDRSDESVESCASNYCPSPFFRCGYGACINANKKCDGVEHCLDGSDESSILCGVRPVSKTTPSIIPETYTERVTTPLPTPAMVDKTSCTAPNIINSNLVYEGSHRSIYPGDEIPNYNSIVYKCKPNYFREGLASNVCVNGKWASGFHPLCIRYCPNQGLKGLTFNVRCKLGEVTVECNNRIKPGTRALVSCPPKYRVPDHNPIQDLLCEEDGQWDYSPSRCEPICGEDVLPNQSFASYGQKTNITEVPWHVGIYMQHGATQRHICGGSIINAKVVLTAAHCFWDTANEDLYDTTLFSIGAGKTMRDYYSTKEIRRPQFRNISEIAIPPEYRQSSVLKGDLAILILTQPLVFSDFIAPICIKWERDAAKAITNGVYGKVAGWGYTEAGTFSEELQSIAVPASSYQTCKNEVDLTYKESVGDDKFCVANKFGTAVCAGDSGGGFAVKKEIDGKGRYFLWGVVSYGVPKGLLCSKQIFDSYTNIQFYEGFIKNMETLNRPR